MAIRYNKLWKRLIDENMMKVDLRDQAGITTNALAKLGKNEHVSTQVLEKVCNVLHCEIQDIMEFVPDEEREMNILDSRNHNSGKLETDIPDVRNQLNSA